MNFITKANAHDHALRVHVQLAGNRTRCGLLLSPAQEDLAGCNCQRCLKSLAAKNKKQRAIKRLNGQRVSPNQREIFNQPTK